MMEAALRVVHVGGDLAAHRVDVHLLAVKPLQDLLRLRRGLLAEVRPDELPDRPQLYRMRPSIGLDDGRGKDQQAHEETVPLLIGRISVLAGLGLTVGTLTGLLPVSPLPLLPLPTVTAGQLV